MPNLLILTTNDQKQEFENIQDARIVIKTKEDFNFGAYDDSDQRIREIIRQYPGVEYFLLHDTDIFPESDISGAGIQQGYDNKIVCTFHHIPYVDRYYEAIITSGVDVLIQLLINDAS